MGRRHYFEREVGQDNMPDADATTSRGRPALAAVGVMVIVILGAGGIIYLPGVITTLRVRRLVDALVSDAERGAAPQEETIDALSRVGEPAIEELIDLLASENTAVAGAATLVLGRIGRATAVPLMECLQGACRTEGAEVLRRNATAALCQASDDGALDAFRYALDTRSLPFPEIRETVNTELTADLGGRSPDLAVQVLRRLRRAHDTGTDVSLYADCVPPALTNVHLQVRQEAQKALIALCRAGPDCGDAEACAQAMAPALTKSPDSLRRQVAELMVSASRDDVDVLYALPDPLVHDVERAIAVGEQQWDDAYSTHIGAPWDTPDERRVMVTIKRLELHLTPMQMQHLEPQVLH